MVLFLGKTKTLFRRDLSTFKVTGELTDERYRQVRDWLVTEKMDGMSVILSITPGDCAYYGRSDKTNFNAVQAIFMEQELNYAATMLYQGGFEKSVNLYAELVGPGVQGNPHNLDALTLRVFDARINDFWLDWDNVCDIATRAGLETVKVIHPLKKRLKMLDVIWFIKDTASNPSGEYLEGYVARTDPYLYDNMGNRIMWKLKVTDY